MSRTHAARRATFLAGVGGISILSMLVLNLAADRMPSWTGLGTLRDYVTRRAG